MIKKLLIVITALAMGFNTSLHVFAVDSGLDTTPPIVQGVNEGSVYDRNEFDWNTTDDLIFYILYDGFIYQVIYDPLSLKNHFTVDDALIF